MYGMYTIVPVIAFTLKPTKPMLHKRRVKSNRAKAENTKTCYNKRQRPNRARCFSPNHYYIHTIFNSFPHTRFKHTQYFRFFSKTIYSAQLLAPKSEFSKNYCSAHAIQRPLHTLIQRSYHHTNNETRRLLGYFDELVIPSSRLSYRLHTTPPAIHLIQCAYPSYKNKISRTK